MFKLSRKGRVALVLVAVVAVAGGAYAYWTAGGTGSGTATAKDATQPLTITQTTTLTAMYPGDSPQTLSGNFDNPNPGPIRVASVIASIDSVTKASGVSGTCDASDFTLANATMNVGAEVPSGDGKGSWAGATIQFNNKPDANQDACKGATVRLAYAIA